MTFPKTLKLSNSTLVPSNNPIKLIDDVSQKKQSKNIMSFLKSFNYSSFSDSQKRVELAMTEDISAGLSQ